MDPRAQRHAPAGTAAALLTLLVAIPLAAGCYTVLRHPDSGDLVAEESGSRRACADCHGDSPFYRDAFDPHVYGYGGYWVYPGWSEYYYRPWWYSDYWYYSDSGTGEPVETRGRHMWDSGGRRELGTSVPPVYPGLTGQPAGGASGSAPSEGSGASGSSSSAPPATSRSDGRDDGSYRSTSRREIGTPEPRREEGAKPDSQPPRDDSKKPPEKEPRR